MITIHTPSRLHFGLLSFGNPNVPAFGGVGIMIDQTGVCLKAEKASRFGAEGPRENRILKFAASWANYYKTTLPRCVLSTSGEIFEHQGFGLGTQLGLAVATALNFFCEKKSDSIEELSVSVDRGRRSAVGSFGFHQGGFIYESRETPNDDFSRLKVRLEVPDAWRFLLIMQPNHSGFHGEIENSAFKQIPPVSETTTTELKNIIETVMIPSLQKKEFSQFSESVYQYGYLAGLCYETVQCGAYMNATNQSVVEFLRKQGIAGVGQSSWGPTLFAICEDIEMAQRTQSALEERFPAEQLHYKISASCNQGHTLQPIDSTDKINQ